jgi:putative ABC transport system permease protein
MTALGLSWRWLWSRPTVTALNLVMLSLGLGAMLLISLVSEQLEHQAGRDLAGIDLVVGAKGSPLQLILAGVFHIDTPPGNIPAATQAQMAALPQVASVIPISLGDSWQGFRIVGTEASLMAQYEVPLAEGRTSYWAINDASVPTIRKPCQLSPSEMGMTLAEGRAWSAPLEAVLGADVARRTKAAVGTVFVGSHGLGGGGEAHGETPYRVVGRLQPCACVLDRLVLTSTESVWAVHEDATALDDEDRAALREEREVTMLLVRYATPLAAVTMPRWVQAQPGLQAAVPALEAARLFRLLGTGLDVLRGLAAVLLLVAGLSVWVALVHAVREREPDLAMLRLLGAPPRRVATVLVLEALWLALLGVLAGLVLGHGMTALLGWALQAERSLSLTGWWWSVQHLWLAGVALGLVGLAVIWPVWRVVRLDVARLLQGG